MGGDSTGETLHAVSLKRRAEQKKRRDGEFLRGPIPLPWLLAASALPGKAVLKLALLLWFRAGIEGRQTAIRLSSSSLKRFGITARTAFNALEALEAAHLIRVERHRGRNPLVSLRKVPKGRK